MKEKINIQNVYELTPLQEGMVFNHIIDNESKAYLEQVEFKLEGNLNIPYFETSFQRLVNRHDAFRTIIRYSKLKKPLQVVLKERKAAFQFEDLSAYDEKKIDRIIEEYKEKDLARGFILDKDSLIRVKVFKQTETSYAVIVSFHHIVLDGWGLGVALNEWLEIYAGLLNNKPIDLPNSFSYSDYIVWLKKQNFEQASLHWERALEGYDQKAGFIPVFKRKADGKKFLHSSFIETFNESLTESLSALAKSYNVTFNAVLRSIWGLLLQKYNNTDDVVFGTVVSGRPPQLSGIEQAIGLFINTVPVRIKGEAGQTFKDLLLQVHEDIQEENKFHYYPLYEVLSKSELKNDLLDHVIAFENYPLDKQLLLAGQYTGLSISEMKIFEQTNYDFHMNIVPGEKTTLNIIYNSEIYNRQYIEQIFRHFQKLAIDIVQNPNKDLFKYEVLTEDEKSEQLKNNINSSYPTDKTIHELFELQVSKNPDKKAAVFGSEYLTYDELNSRASTIAEYLRKKGVRRQESIVLIANKSLETLVAMLAILKSGCAYVPVDPASPVERIQYILQDCSARFLISPSDWASPSDFTGQVIKIDNGIYESTTSVSSEVYYRGEANSLAYIIYTSGTTGKPKGVMVEHKNVTSLILNEKMPYQFSDKDIWTIFHSFSFDFSVWEMYGALLYGGTCVIVPKDIAQNPKKFLSLLQSENVTVLNQTPSAFSHLIEEVSFNGVTNLNLRYVIFGGEALKPAMLYPWKLKFPNIHLINMYGITETTVHVTYKEITKHEIEENTSNIGKPLPSLNAYIMNEHQQLVPTGTIGELYIGGEGVTRGYINKEALTKERFMLNPYNHSEIIYRSGDIVRKLNNGEMEYLGRIDHQVKVRGHRIELGEIENQLLVHPNIKEAVVVSFKDHTDMTYLCAYVVSDRELSSTVLRTYLSSFLPDYMIPAHFVFLASLPLTGNGKIDRKALPKPEVSSNFAYVEPQTSLEGELAKIWKEVLGVERVGIHDHFFELGGHSLRATQLVNMIHKNLDIELPLKMVFEKPTIQLMCQEIEKLNPSEKRVFHEIQKVEEQEYYPASSAQKRLLILNQLENIGNNYNITGAVQLEGPVDPKRLEQAIQQVINRHEALRTSFETTEEGFIQRVHPHVPFSLEQWEEKEPKASQSVNRFSRPFNLSNAPLLRAGLVKTGPECHVLILDMHHSISDEASLKTMLKEISLLYKGEVLPPLRLQYKDVAAWQTERMKTKEFLEAETFWLKEMSGELPVLDISRRERPKFQSFEGDRVDFHVPTSLAQQLSELATKTGTTLYMVLLSAYQLLLSRYSGQEDIIVGSPVASRPHADLQNMVGMFVNTIPMRNSLSEEESIRSLLQKVRERALLAFEHQSYPFEQLVEKVSITRDLSRNPVFDHMFIMHDAGTAKLELENVDITSYSLEDRSAKVDLTLEVSENEMGLSAWFQYSTALFSKDEMKIMSSHFVNILEEIVKDTDQPLSSIEMISEAERYTLLHDLNPKTVAGVERTVHQRFEEQVTHTPAQIAVISSGREYTYQEINERANRMARALQNMNVEKGDRIGVMVKRSEDLIIALLAVLKTGAAYVPIDPDYPEDRIAYMVHDSNTKYIMTDVREGRLSSFDEKLCLLSDLADQSEDGSNLEVDVLATELAYIIYTSGSTGKPKGVMVEHRSVHNFIEGMSECVKMASGDKVLALTTVSFDIFVTETFLPLAKGACVIMASEEEQQDPALLSSLIMDNEVTTIQATPSRIKGLLMYPEGEECLETVKVMIVGGEALPPTLLQSLQAYTNLTVYNAYGPTETTVYSSIRNVTSDHEVTIGQPIRNTRCYIVGPHNRFQPIGVLGELCIAGSGVSRGYLNRPELTASKFVEDPFVSGEIMYKTGDLARWLPDGQIEYAGRIDQQVKMRGYRIELQEVEACIEEFDTIREAAVTLHTDSLGDAYLCAYVVWNDVKKAASFKELKVELARKLPGYMVPTHMIELEQLPLTANGKLDRKVLPKPKNLIDVYIYPETETEKQMETIWREVLGIKNIGVDDNFFALGGHSLKATMLIAKVKRVLKKELSLSTIFENPTIREFSKRLDNQTSNVYMELEPVGRRDTYPLSSSQRRLFVLSQFPEIGTSYNMPSAWTIHGYIDVMKLQKALEKVTDRHEILRTTFGMADGNPIQLIHESVNVRVECVDASKDVLSDIIKSFIRPFDLTQGPLFRTALITISHDHQLLLFDMHHILSDGTSIQILAEEIMAFYNGNELSNNRIQYKDYTVWQQEQLNSDFYLKQQEFWMNVFKDNIPVLELVPNQQRKVVPNYIGSQLSCKIQPSLMRKVNEIAKKTESSIYMIFLAVYNILLSKYSGQEDIVIGSPVAGRSREEIQNTIGVFVNMLPMRNQPEGTKRFDTFLQEVKKQTLSALEHQDYPFEDLIDKLGILRDPSRHPLFDTVLVHQNIDQSVLSFGNISANSYELRHGTAKFDITVEILDVQEDTLMRWEYRSSHFGREMIERMASHFLHLLEEVINCPERHLADLTLPSHERTMQLNFNDTNAEFELDRTVVEMFEEQSKKKPGNTAVVYRETKWSYERLNQEANQLARHLQAKGLSSEQIVAILVEPSVEMILAVLAVLKAGGAYVPIDPNYPSERIQYMIEDSQAEIVITHHHLTDKVNGEREKVILEERSWERESVENLPTSCEPNGLAYVIYTSGTTGHPKGVMIEHRSLSNLCQWHNDQFELTEWDRSTKIAGFGFDASVWEILPPLLKGAALYIVPEELRTDIHELNKFFEQNQITISFLPTPLCEPFLALDNQSLRVLLTGGDKLKTYQPVRFRLINNYGPTENTVVATSGAIDHQSTNLPIGRPIANTQVYILGKNHELQPIGVPGELCIAGEGLARGYLNQPELTAEKFIEHPHEAGSRLYRSGDLARWLPDGSIEYLGRIDDQVKIRGHRIELGEIEAQLLQMEGVEDAVVLAHKDSDGMAYLCGYLVSREDVTISAIRNHLSRTLPDYMIPASYVLLDQLPLTPNGKVDKRALPEPKGLIHLGVGYEAPQGEAEQRLALVWKEVLKAGKVGRHDHFFDLGGDSIKGIQVAARLHEKGWKLELKDLFRYPTVAELAPYVLQVTGGQISQEEVTGEVCLSPIQRWFFDQRFEEAHHWNQAVLLESPEDLDPVALQSSFESLLHHHDALRMTYREEDGRILQWNRSTTEGNLYHWETIQISDIGDSLASRIEEECTRLQTRLNLAEGPLVIGGLFQTKKSDYFFVAIHHLAVDGVSWRILLEDLWEGYQQAKRYEPIQLPMKTDSFQKWSSELTQYVQSRAIKKELAYWKDVMSIPVTPLPKDGDASENRIADEDHVIIQFTREETARLVKEANRAFRTEINDLLLTALHGAVQEWTGVENLVVDLEGHGREFIGEGIDISRTVGWFTSMFPVALTSSGSIEVGEKLQAIKEQLRRIPNKGIGFGLLAYLSSLHEKLQTYHPEIGFNYLGDFGEGLQNDKQAITMSDISSGTSLGMANHRVHTLEMNGMTLEGSLQFRVSFNRFEFKKSTIETFAEGFKRNLNQLVDFCIAQEQSVKTPSDVGLSTLPLEVWKDIQQVHSAESIEEIRPLSPMQEGILFESLMNPNSPAYFEQLSFVVNGKLEREYLWQSFQDLAVRHDILRTVFTTEGEHPLQIVVKELPLDVKEFSLLDITPDERQAAIEARKEADKEAGFDLKKGPLMRLTVLETDKEEFVLIWSHHHILMDGWCLGILLQEFLTLYAARKEGRRAELGPVESYGRYIEWLTNQDREVAKEYWREKVAGYVEQASLPKKQMTVASTYKQEEMSYTLSTTLTKQVEQVARHLNSTISTVLQAAWGVLLSRYSQQEDVIFGTVVSGRPPAVKGIEKTVGLFINTIPVRFQAAKDKTFVDLVKEGQSWAVSSQEHSFLSLAEIQAESKLGQGLIDHLFIVENYPFDDEAMSEIGEQAGLRIKNEGVFEQTSYDFNAIVVPGKQIQTLFRYNAEMYNALEVKGINQHFQVLLQNLIKNLERKLSSIEMLPTSERSTIFEFNPIHHFGRERTVHQVIEEQTTLTPIEIAVVSKDKEFTYQEINERANRMARALRNMNVEKGDRIGVMVKRSEDLIISLLAVLKTGAAYVPIDPDYPEDRIAYMVHDSNTKYIMTDVLEGRLSSFDEKLCLLSDLADQNEDGSNLEVDVLATELAYIIYTSGSTGKPKGVMVEHRSVHNFIEGMSECVKMASGDKVLALTTVSFDIFVTETFLPLAKGACVIMASEEEQQDPALLSSLIMDNEVTAIQATPSRIKGLLMYPEGEECLETVKVMIVGGEALPSTLLQSLQAYTNLTVYNAYGPTETTVYSSIRNVTSDHEVTIGQPIRNTRCYIVGPHNRLQPIGVLGELCIAGSGVSRGYLNRPELTASKFVEDSFVSGEIMYKTGDLARWLPDGQIEYAGRIDQQVKMRGYRIELQEVEACIEEFDTIREAAVTLHTDSLGDAYLCAYVVWNDVKKAASFKELKVELARKLPGYMVPTHMIELEQLPLTANGKLDRKVLPKPKNLIDVYIYPETETEKQMETIWREVLGIKNIGVDDNFFALGGHSLKAIMLVGKVKKTLGKELSLSKIFEVPTIRELSEHLEKQTNNVYQELKLVAPRSAYPLSSAQRRLFVLNQFPEIGTSYNMPSAWTIHGGIDAMKLQKALEKVTDRHDTLRTTFEMLDGKPVQLIHESVCINMEYFNASKEELPNVINRFVRPFDLAQGPLFRTALITISHDHQLLLFDMHHILSDGTSVQILAKEVMAFYNGEGLSNSRIQYKDYAVWQQEQIISKNYLTHQDFWMEIFKDSMPSLDIMTDYPRTGIANYAGSQISFKIKHSVMEKINELAKKTDSSSYMIFLAVYNILLSKYSGQEDIVIGSPVSGRSREEIQNIIGVFVNMLPMRNQPEGTKRFHTFLQEVKKQTLLALEHQDYPFEDLVDKLEIPRDPSRHPLFETVLAHQNVDQSGLSFDDTFAHSYGLPHITAKFDLTVEIIDEPEGTLIRWEYRTTLFKRETIERMATHFLHILEDVLDNPDKPLSEISLSIDERKKQKAFNDTKAEYDLSKTIIEIIENQSEHKPNNLAIVFGEEKWTYKRLNQEANQLARHLQAKGLSSEQIVAILVEPSVEMILAVLAVLKAGGAYVPIDPNYPLERIQYMIEDSQAEIVITHHHLTDKVNGEREKVILEERSWERESVEKLPIPREPNELAYVIYTSGTTGHPKGVMIEHRSLSNLCQWHNDQFELTELDRSTKIAGFGFDASVWEIFPPLLKGAALYIVPEELRTDIHELNKFFEQNQITISFLPTPLCEPFLALDNQSLRVLLTGGDKLKTYQPVRFQLINNYGPTENTVVATSGAIDHQSTNLPIGRPIANTRVYILGQNHELQPIGVPGELCIAGEGLARGYLNQPELTAEKFIEHPHEPGSRLYRSGDLARWLPDGSIEYIGRIDDQVKIRGHRIELGEIEAQLLQMEGVEDTVVLARNDADGTAYLCGYLVSREDVTISAIRNHLSRTLPDYMIPTSYVLLDQLPLTPNGKVDKRALPEPEGLIHLGVEYEAPQREAELRLARVWKEVLKAEKVGRHDHFFDLGGDSIKGIQVAARLHEKGWKLELKDLFRYPTVAELAPYVLQVTGGKISQEEVTGEVCLSPIQRWFFDQRFEEAHHWNQAVLLESPEDLDPVALQSSFESLLHHHDALRMTYREEDGRILQWNRSTTEGNLYHWETIQISDIGDSLASRIEEECTRLQTRLNLAEGPLVIGGLFQTKKSDYFFVAIHHLAVDGVSWRILLEDLWEGYQQAKRYEPIQLPMKTDSFQKWSSELTQYVQSRAIKKELAYWKDVMSIPVTPLPKDGDASENRIADEDHVIIQFTREETARLVKEANRAFRTEINDLLLTALHGAVQEWTGVENLVVDLEGHGREFIGEGIDISRTVGWFTSMFPVALTSSGSIEVGEKLQAIKEQLRRIPNKGIGFGLLAYLSSLHEKLQTYHPEIGFNYLGDFGEGLQNDKQAITMSDISSGTSLGMANHRVHTLEINGMTLEGSLQFRVSFNRFEFKKSTIETFAEGFKRNLNQLVDYCIAQEQSVKTPSDVGLSTLPLEVWKDIQQVHSAESIEEIRPLSPMQEGILFESLMNPNLPAYFEQLSFVVNGKLEKEYLWQSFQDLAVRHDILRTVFTTEGEHPLQIVVKELLLDVKEFSLLDITPDERQAAIEAKKEADKEKGFDLKKGPLMRLTVLETDKEEFVLIWSHHHILMDGWCLGILLQEFLTLYAARKEGRRAELGPVESYGRYIEWLTNQDREVAKEYWREKVAGYVEQASLPKKQMTVASTYKQEEMSYTMSTTLTKRVEQVARHLNSTISTVLQAAWGVLLSRYSQQEDVIFGTVVSGRPPAVKGIEKTVGLFINTIPVRFQAAKDKTFMDLVKEGQSWAVSSQEHSFLSLAEIQAESKLGSGLLDHLFVVENYPFDKDIMDKNEKIVGLGIKAEGVFEQTNYDFNVIVNPGDQLSFTYRFNSEIYDEFLVRRISRSMEKVLESICVGPTQSLFEIEILSEEEKMVVREFNNTNMKFPLDKTLDQLIQDQAMRSPFETAIVCGDRRITYQDLSEQANAVATRLIQEGVKPGDHVGIITGRKAETVAGLLGILKAGAAYVPMEPDYPKERVYYIQKQSHIKNIIMDEEALHLEKKLLQGTKIIGLEEAIKNKGSQVKISKDPQSLAYIIYTSGSTGRPKGVMIEHKSIVNLIHWVNQTYMVGANDRLLWMTSMCFDLSVYDIFGILASGGTVVIAQKEDVQDPVRLRKMIIKEKITFWDSVPTTLHHFLRGLEEGQEAYWQENLRLIFLSGDWIPVNLKKRSEVYFPNAKMIGLGGATEGTIWSNYYPVETVYEGQKSIPYGKPIGNNTFYILDADQCPVPQGVTGELYIGGIGVARGYIGDLEKTSVSFMKDPFRNEENATMYRTGDLGRLLPDGNMEFLGRMDHQVKVRGYRIELGEVEALLTAHPRVKESVVTVIKDGDINSGVAAYLVGDKTITDNELRQYLFTYLPKYMLPAHYIWLEEMPLSSNGKIDRKSLPNPKEHLFERVFESPDTVTAKALAEIWTSLLGIENVSMNDSFFDVGGYSLKATVLVAKIYKKWGIEVPLEWVFRYSTLRELSEKIDVLKTNILMEDNPVTSLSEGTFPIFCFPPVAGFGFEFKGLADNLPDHTVYAFDFIEGEDRFERYVSIIKSIQPEGVYMLLGYSAGGNLAFEVAKALEKSGEFVSKLIILDANRKTNIEHSTDKQLDAEIEAQLQAADSNYHDWLAVPALRQKVQRRIKKYRRFLEETVNDGFINADIIVICSEDTNGMSWVSSTKGKHKVIRGYGNHTEMLSTPFVGKHAEILRSIYTLA
ncbi:non-ribosomal peptide synthase/polyketide synthase [Cytobacillus dafuensis]|uniref:Amino acid adenylation domain-containing protein n=1 Tax=Cytobacillus dafuensis TaxID=1742359 RepID=A0A5B8Z2A2_CYTDA|nr:non-ribosomal peptide synthase/polyketide synthase [Cytobacillus dafuensis]QED47028.1 amino acid adenylation domain-containing protein [Cytobacillus dafuensis]